VGEYMQAGAPSLVGAHLWKDQVNFHRSLGKEHLNYQFGWLPLVNDIRTFARSIRSSRKILESYIKSSNQNIRVAYEFDRKSDFTNPTNRFGVRTSSTNTEISNFRFSATAEESKRTWFKGCFAYHLPMSTRQHGEFKSIWDKADHLLGIRLTPEVVWNLTPWSWAVDYFTNVGDLLHNVSELGHDGLALRYGYVMHHSVNRITASATPRSGTPVVAWDPVSYTGLYESKTRFPASPYSGFGTTAALSTKQKSILLALGATKL
jgi:hypothetical protein